MSSLDKFMVKEGNSVYYESSFRDMLEDHMHVLKTVGNRQHRRVSAQVAYKNEHNFYGLLTDIGVPREHQWLVMRLNGLLSPADFNGKETVVLIPDYRRVESLAKVHRTRKSLV